MSNNDNYIQETEFVQQTFKITQKEFEDNKFLNDGIKKPKYAIGFLYLIIHKETGYMYSGSKLAYSLKDANTYCGSSLGKTISDICTKNKILQNGIDQYEFKLIMFCKSTEQMRDFEDELNHFNIYFNGLKCLNGRGRNLRSSAGISLTEQTKKKIRESNKGRNKGIPKSEETKKKISELHKGKTLTEEHKKKIRESCKDINKGIPKSEEAKKKMSEAAKIRSNLQEWKDKQREVQIGKQRSEEVKKKMSESSKGKSKSAEHKKKMSESSKGKSKPKYYCPYNNLYINVARVISIYIKNNYPQLKQWSEFTKEEKQSYLVLSPEASVLIAN